MLTYTNVKCISITDALFKMLEINKQILCAVCVTFFRNFCQIVNYYSDRMCQLVSQYDLLIELVKGREALSHEIALLE
jgi:hypothetical protein